MAINVERGKPVFDNIKAGLAGPAIKPIALRMVYDLCSKIKTLPPKEQIPVIGLGGIANWIDAVEFIMAGASGVAVGTANFINPKATIDVLEGIVEYCQRYNLSSLEEIRGII